MPATIVVRWAEGETVREGDLADIATARASGDAWVDVRDPDPETLAQLHTTFGLHPLAIEDVLHDEQRPKLEGYDDHLFFVWRVPSGVEGERMRATELDVFLGKGWLVTLHPGPVVAIDDLAKDACGALKRGPEWVLHAILDRAVDEIFPVIDAVGDDLDEIGDALLDHVDRSQLERLHRMKRLLLQAHKVVGPERDALRELEREQEYVSADAYRYFQDVSDHLARVADSIDTYRDVAASVMDVYLSAVSNQLNVVMKRLTVIATIFMPGTLVASIFGMNVGFPLRDTFAGAVVALIIIAVTSAVMYVFFRRSELW